MPIKTYTNQKYGFTKPYIDNLNRMENTLNDTAKFKTNKINNLYNQEIQKLNKVKNDVVQTGQQRSKAIFEQPKDYTDTSSIINTTTNNKMFKGLGGKISESSGISLMNTARSISNQAMDTTATILRGIDNDMATAKANRDINLAQSAKQKFDLLYDNFYQINEAYLSNRELLQKLEEE